MNARGVLDWHRVPAGSRSAVEIYRPLPSQGWKMEGGMYFFPHQLIPKLRAAPSDQASAAHFSQVRLVETLTGGKLFTQGKQPGFY